MRRLTLFVALLFPVTIAGAQQEFFLKSHKTGGSYGPFKFAHSNEVVIGKVKFSILLKDPPAKHPLQDPAPAQSNPEAEQAALAAAAPWLQIVDAGKYEESWSGIADYLKRGVKKDEFLSSLKTVRAIFGARIKREAKRTQYLTSMPSAPDGSYVVIQYVTQFETKKAAVETVVLALEKDGKWRISGYDVR